MVVICQICGFETYSHLQSHLTRKHGIKPKDYERKFPGFYWCSEEFKKKMSVIRKNNANTPQALRAKRANGKANKGKKRTEEFKFKRGLQFSGVNNPFYGRSHSYETKVRLSCHFQGILEEDFAGFTKAENYRKTKSGAFKTWRRLVFERDNYTCLFCGKRGGPLEPHHIIPRREDISKIYQISNGATLCKPCHKKTFNKEHEFVEFLTKEVGRGVALL